MHRYFWQLFRSEQNERRLLYDITGSHMIHFYVMLHFGDTRIFAYFYVLLNSSETPIFAWIIIAQRTSMFALILFALIIVNCCPVITVNIVGGPMLNMVMHIMKVLPSASSSRSGKISALPPPGKY
jgi:hypothetical protein